MKALFRRFGRRRASGYPLVVLDALDAPTPSQTDTDVDGTGSAAASTRHEDVAAAVPEQPVLLNTSGQQPARVGELLPARRGRSPLALVRLPAVPKRVILAAGVCAGLAGPAVARHLVSRALFGRSAAVAGGAIEITRIIYNGPLTPQAAAAIGKALTAARR